MATFSEYLGNKTNTATKKKSSSFSDFIKQNQVEEQKKKVIPLSQSPFNPNNPANTEFNKQLDQRTNKTFLQKVGSGLGDVGNALKEVSKYAVGSESLPAQAIKMYTQPSEMVKQAESSIPNVPILKETARAVLRTIIPMAEGFGTIIGSDIINQRQQAENLNKTKITKTVGKQVQTNTPADLVTNKLTAEEIVNVALNSIQVGLLITPLVSKYATKGTLNLAETFSKESKVPITYTDLQKITSSSSDAQAIARVGQEKFNAYREAANSNTVREALKQGYVSLAEKQPTTFSNILKNAATRPVTEVANFNKTYGAKIQTTTPTLLSEKAGQNLEVIPQEPVIAGIVKNGVVEPTGKTLTPIIPVTETPISKKIVPSEPVIPKTVELPTSANIQGLEAKKMELLKQQDFSGTEESISVNKKIYSQIDKLNKEIETAKTQEQINSLNKEVQIAKEQAIKEKSKVKIEKIPTPKIAFPVESKSSIAAKQRMIKLLEGKTPAQVKQLFKTIPGLQKMFPDGKLVLNTSVKAPQTLKTAPKTEISAKADSLTTEARKYKSAEEFVKAQGTPKTVQVWNKSKFSNEGAYADIPVIRKEENITLYHGGENGQFWTPNKKYAEQFGNVKEKTGTFYKVDNGNRVTDVYVEAPTKPQLTDIWKKANDVIKAPKTMPLDAPKSMPAKTPSKIAKSIEQKAIESKLTQGFEGIAGYDKITIKDQAQRAAELVNSNLDQARAIIRGESPLPDGLNGVALITAMEEHIKLNPNTELAYELANSSLVSETSVAGQTLRLAAERTPDSATAKLQEIRKAREAKAEKQVSKEVEKVVKTAKSEVEKVHLTKEELSWDKFLTEIQC